jgi:hypothetical protein
MTADFHLMLNVRRKSSSNFTNNAVILHAVDNGHSVVDDAKTTNSPLPDSKQQRATVSSPEAFRNRKSGSSDLPSLSFGHSLFVICFTTREASR